MRVLIVGDVHGCYYTFKTLIENHWNKKEEFLVLTGDIINKGPHSLEAFLYFLKLKEKDPYQVYMVRGNHEQNFLNTLNSNKSNGYKSLIQGLKQEGYNREKLTNILAELPYKWETPHILVTHGGVGEKAKNPYSSSSANGVLYNRNTLKNIGKVQVHGHDILKEKAPQHVESSNSWNVDTGAWTGNALSAIRLTRKGKLKDIIQENLHPADTVD